MKYKIPVVLTLLILIPLILLGWLGARLQGNEKIVAEHQFQQLADSRLREAEQTISRYFSELENEVLATLNLFMEGKQLGASSSEEIRSLVRRTALFDNLFILDVDGLRLFPPQDQQASDSERNFIEQTQPLWLDPDAFRPNPAYDSAAELALNQNEAKSRYSVSGALSQVSRQDGNATISKIDEKLAPSADYGWTVWDVGTQTQTFFWLRDGQQNLIGIKISAPQWISALINRLPDDRDASQILGGDRIKLVNQKQDVVYQWGQFEDSLLEGAQPRGQRLLGQPLGGWRLQYYSPRTQSSSDLQWLFYLLLLSLIGLVLISMGRYMLQEYRRDMKLAEQRVTFVNQVSHELKTPLTNICMYADLLESQVAEGGLGDKQLVKKYSSVLTTESQRLGRLINNVLSFSRSREQQMELSFKPGVIDDTICKTAEMFKPAFSAKGIEIELDLAATQEVLFDTEALEQIVNNLLGNIEKYAYRGKLARISSQQKAGLTTIVVEDAGPGIDSKAAKHLFEPFVRGSSKLTEGVSGTGIGLTIARELCRLHGGDLQLATRQTDTVGARFVVTLKTAQEDTAK